jgi:hypothetical protein
MRVFSTIYSLQPTARGRGEVFIVVLLNGRYEQDKTTRIVLGRLPPRTADIRKKATSEMVVISFLNDI